jgi:hypothetical protein
LEGFIAVVMCATTIEEEKNSRGESLHGNQSNLSLSNGDYETK